MGLHFKVKYPWSWGWSLFLQTSCCWHTVHTQSPLPFLLPESLFVSRQYVVLLANSYRATSVLSRIQQSWMYLFIAICSLSSYIFFQSIWIGRCWGAAICMAASSASWLRWLCSPASASCLFSTSVFCLSLKQTNRQQSPWLSPLVCCESGENPMYESVCSVMLSSGDPNGCR